MRSGVTLGFVAALWLAFTASAGAALPGHLWVAESEDPTTVYRYPLHAGIPAKRPDYSLVNGSAEAWTVDTAGNLYVIGLVGLTVYPPGATTPSYRHAVFNGYDMGFFALAVSGDTVYASFVYSPSAGGLPAGADGPPCGLFEGVVAYHIHGARWLEGCVSVAPAQDSGSIATDAAGDLYVDEPYGASGGKIDVFGAAPHMALLRQMTGPTINEPYGLALDGAGGLLTIDSGSEGTPYVATYPALASGNTARLRAIEPQHKGTMWYGGVAADAKFTYVGQYRAVVVYPAGANGRPAPIAVLPYGELGAALMLGP